MPTHRPTRAFTLIELLAVIPIIAVLISLLLPALRHAREAGRAAVCLSNQRQIATALNVYANTYRDYIPREGGAARNRAGWCVLFRPLLDPRVSPNVDLDDRFATAPYYHCPSRRSGLHNVHYVATGFKFSAPGVPLLGSDAHDIGARGPIRLADPPRPAAMLYMMDFGPDPGDVLFNRWGGATATDLAIGQFYDAWHTRHLDPTSDDFRTGPRQHGTGAHAL